MSKILALSGSLREHSLNTIFLRAASRLAPEGINIIFYNALNEIPLFNPDIEGENFDKDTPAAVKHFRDQLHGVDGVMIASPEYAHGVSGVMKNALDWLVGTGEFVDLPIALVNVSPRATIAYSALHETICVMGGIIVPEASPTIPLIEKKDDLESVIANSETSTQIKQTIISFDKAIKELPISAPVLELKYE